MFLLNMAGLGAPRQQEPISCTVSYMQKVRQLNQGPATLGSEIKKRLLCGCAATAALTEMVGHMGLLVGVTLGTLAKNIVVKLMDSISWALWVAKFLLFGKILTNSLSFWMLFLLTEAASCVINPVRFFRHWCVRVRVLSWTSSRDDWLWNVSCQIDQKLKPFFNQQKVGFHYERTLLFAKAATSLTLGFFMPNKAFADFQKLGIEPVRLGVCAKTVQKVKGNWGKIALTALVAATVIYDYRRQGTTLTAYSQQRLLQLMEGAGTGADTLLSSASWIASCAYRFVRPSWLSEGPDWKLLNRYLKEKVQKIEHLEQQIHELQEKFKDFKRS